MPTDYPFRDEDDYEYGRRGRGSGGAGDGLRDLVGDFVARNLGRFAVGVALAIMLVGMTLGSWWSTPSPYASLQPYSRPQGDLPMPPAAPVPTVEPLPAVPSLPADGRPYGTLGLEPLVRPAPPVVWPEAKRDDPFNGIDPTGVVLRDVVQVEGEKTFLNAVGDWLRLPTRDFRAASDGWKEPHDFTPFRYAAAADGKGVPAMPTASRLLGYAGLCLLACVVAIFGAEAIKYAGFKLGFHHVGETHYADRPRWVMVLEGVLTSAVLLAVSAMLEMPALAGLGVFSIPLWSLDWQWRARWFLTMLGVGAATKLFGIPVVPPAASLVESYGPLGLYCWDIVATGGIALACMGQWLVLRGQRITYVTVAAPRR